MSGICGINCFGFWDFAPKGLMEGLFRRALPYANAHRALPCANVLHSLDLIDFQFNLLKINHL
jgi:hypothetical protein